MPSTGSYRHRIADSRVSSASRRGMLQKNCFYSLELPRYRLPAGSDPQSPRDECYRAPGVSDSLLQCTANIEIKKLVAPTFALVALCY
jgi:hypothetical protein